MRVEKKGLGVDPRKTD